MRPAYRLLYKGCCDRTHNYRGPHVKNLSLPVKVGLLVAVLLATILIVAIVGVVELTRLDARFNTVANVTSKAVFLTGDGRIDLLVAIRCEKNTILTQDKAK